MFRFISTASRFMILLAIGTLLISCQKLNQSLDDCIIDHENICENLKMQADKINEDLPKDIGDLTYLSVKTNKREIIHTYGVHTSIEDAASSAQMTTDELRLNQQLLIQKLACENDSIRSLLDKQEITITYVYKFTDDQIQFSLTKCTSDVTMK